MPKTKIDLWRTGAGLSCVSNVVLSPFPSYLCFHFGCYRSVSLPLYEALVQATCLLSEAVPALSFLLSLRDGSGIWMRALHPFPSAHRMYSSHLIKSSMSLASNIKWLAGTFQGNGFYFLYKSMVFLNWQRPVSCSLQRSQKNNVNCVSPRTKAHSLYQL